MKYLKKEEAITLINNVIDTLKLNKCKITSLNIYNIIKAEYNNILSLSSIKLYLQEIRLRDVLIKYKINFLEFETLKINQSIIRLYKNNYYNFIVLNQYFIKYDLASDAFQLYKNNKILSDNHNQILSFFKEKRININQIKNMVKIKCMS